MAEMAYRIVSACGAPGFGFPKASRERAPEDGVDAVVSDAGSMDAGPCYPGTGNESFEWEAVEAHDLLRVNVAEVSA